MRTCRGDQWLLSTIYLVEPNSAANSQTIPDESMTCIAFKEDGNQKNHEQRSFEEWNRRTLGQVIEWQDSSTRWGTKRSRGKLTQSHNRVQKSCS